jgi:hypothetical protein
MKPFLPILLGAILLPAMAGRAPAQGGFPTWPFVVGAYQNSAAPADAKPAHVMDWKTNVLSTLPSVTANAAAPATPGFDACGNLKFYVLHSGKATDGELFIYSPAGAPLNGLSYAPGNGLNGSRADNEVQVVAVPEQTLSWYIIYSQNVSSSQYTPSNILYSKLVYDVSLDTWTIDPAVKNKPLPVATSGQPMTYNKGKAVSPLMTGGPTPYHFLYVCVRTDNASSPWGNKVQLLRYRITSTGIAHSGVYKDKSPLFSEPWWSMTTVGSPIEVDQQHRRVAMLSRNETNDGMNLYMFQTSDLSANANWRCINIATHLLIEPNTAEIPLYTDAHSASWQSTGTPIPWLKNFERKMNGLEFSPKGNYLYICGGGYVTGARANLTYLGKIDLSAYAGGLPPVGEHLNVRLQTQYADGWNAAEGLGTGSWGSPSDEGYWKYYHGILNLQSSYDGNLYFTKANCDTLWVIPDPDAPFADFPVRLMPGNVDLSTAAATNRKLDGYVQFLPDQIDGYDYLTNNDVEIVPPGPITCLTVGGTLTQTLTCLYQGTAVTNPNLVQWTGSGVAVTENSDATCTVAPTVPGNHTVTVEYTLRNGTKCYQDIDIIVKDSTIVTPVDLCGVKYEDLDGDGVKDPGEPGIEGWIIVLNAGTATQQVATTDANGQYCFNDLPSGTYTVSEQQQAGWVQTDPASPGTYSIKIQAGRVDTLLFGNHRGGCDDIILGTANSDPLACTYFFSISSPSGNLSPVTSILVNISDGSAPVGTLNGMSLSFPFSPAVPTILNQSLFTVTPTPPVPLPITGNISIAPMEVTGLVTINFTITHQDGTVCTVTAVYQCCPPDPCKDVLTVTPRPDDNQVNMDWRTFRIDNGEPGNPIQKVEIYFDPPLPPSCSGHQGGQLRVDGATVPVVPPGPFVPPYDVVNLMLAPATPAAEWLSFNLGMDIYCSWTGDVILTMTHQSGVCIRTYYGWTITAGMKQSFLDTRSQSRKLVARTLQVRNVDASAPVRWASVTLRNPVATMHAITGASLDAAAGGAGTQVGLSHMGRTTALFEFATPIPPFGNSDDINIVLAMDSGSTATPVLRIVLFDEKGNVLSYDSTSVMTTVATLAKSAAADEFDILGSFPNPANGMTTVNYLLGRRADVRLEVFNELGARVAVLREGMAESGISAARFDVRGLPAGSYYLRLSSGERASTYPFVVAK